MWRKTRWINSKIEEQSLHIRRDKQNDGFNSKVIYSASDSYLKSKSDWSSCCRTQTYRTTSYQRLNARNRVATNVNWATEQKLQSHSDRAAERRKAIFFIFHFVPFRWSTGRLYLNALCTSTLGRLLLLSRTLKHRWQRQNAKTLYGNYVFFFMNTKAMIETRQHLKCVAWAPFRSTIQWETIFAGNLFSELTIRISAHRVRNSLNTK